MQFELIQNVNVLFGAGSVELLGSLMKDLGLVHAFVVCDQGVEKAGILSCVLDILKKAEIRSTVFNRVVADPPSYVVDEAASLCREAECDAVIAVGGGSAIDTGKGINLLRCNPGRMMEYAAPSAVITRTNGLIAIPTTAGTGSELSDGLVITGPDGAKHPILAVNAMVNHAIIDPALMTALPPHLTAATGMDALAQTIESYTSTACTLPIESICEGNITAAIRWLPVATQEGENLEARSRMAAASTISGWMLRYGHTHAGHAVAHVLGARFGIPHGFACAFSLPHVLAFNAPAIPEKTRRVGELFGLAFAEAETPEAIGQQVRDAVIAFRDGLSGMRTARSFLPEPEQATGPSQEKLAHAATEISQELFQLFNPRKMTPQDALEILQAIFA